MKAHLFRAVVVVLVLSLTGAASASAATVRPAKQIRVAFFTAVKANSFLGAVYAGMQQAAKKQGQVTITTFDANFDASKQISQVEDAITSKKYDAFVIVPLNYAGMVPPTKLAIKAGIQVVAENWPIGPRLDTAEPQVPGMAGSVLDPATKDAKSHVQMINAACGKTSPCKVAYVAGNLSGAFDVATVAAIKVNLKTHPNIKLVQKAQANYARDPALKVVTDILQAHSDLNVIDAHGDQMALGAEDAVKAAGKVGKIKILGGGASALGVAAVRQGRWFGTTAVLPFNDGVNAMTLAIKGVLHQKVAKRGIDSVAQSKWPAVLTRANLAAWKDFRAQWPG